MKALAITIMLSGGLLFFWVGSLHGGHLSSNRPTSPNPVAGQVIEFKLRGSPAVYITRKDQFEQFSIIVSGLIIFGFGSAMLKRSYTGRHGA